METHIRCPNCGTRIEVSEALAAQVREELGASMQAELERRFPHDHIEPVPKGMRGADIVQRVADGRGQDCGSIVWETKNTKHRSPAWLDKLKEDQRAVGAAVAVLVSVPARSRGRLRPPRRRLGE